MREPGYYRVKRYGLWEIGFFVFNYREWWLASSVEPLTEDDFQAIDETRIDPKPEGVE